MLDHFFSLLFPKDSESLKILDIRLREVGAKRPLNGTSKVNRQTDRQTDRRTDRRTFQLIESIGPEGRCFENLESALMICKVAHIFKRYVTSHDCVPFATYLNVDKNLLLEAKR